MSVRASCRAFGPNGALAAFAVCTLVALAGCVAEVASEAVGNCAPILCEGAPELANVKAGGTIHSGFLVGTPGIGSPSLIEVSFDGQPFVAASGTDPWSAAIPVPSSGQVWRDGSMHSVRIRSDAGKERVVQVRKGVNRDFNGDGYQDIVSGTGDDQGGANPNRDRLYVFHSSGPNTLISADLSSTPGAAARLDSPGPSAFGYALAAGDFDGDSYADLAVGGYGSGIVFFYYGVGGIGIGDGASPDGSVVIGTGNFGAGVATGDFNGDGYWDLLIGANATTPTSAYVYLSQGAGGISNGGSQDFTLYSAGTSNQYGLVLGAVDVNADGYTEAIITASTLGYAYIFDGQPLSGGGSLTCTNNACPEALVSLNAVGLGTSVATGYMNGDVYGDVILGAASGESAHVFAGNPGGVTQTATLTGTGGTNFGTSVAMGDVNGDGIDDLAIGGSNGVAFTVLAQGTSGIPGGNILSIYNIAVSGSTGFGSIVRLMDTHGQGYADLLVAQPNFNAWQGIIYRYLGSETGVSGSSDVQFLGPSASSFSWTLTP